MGQFNELNAKDIFLHILKGWKTILLSILFSGLIGFAFFSLYNPNEYTVQINLDSQYKTKYTTEYGEFKSPYTSESDLLSTLVSSEFIDYVKSLTEEQNIISEFTISPTSEDFRLNIMSRNQILSLEYAIIITDLGNSYLKFKLTSFANIAFIESISMNKEKLFLRNTYLKNISQILEMKRNNELLYLSNNQLNPVYDTFTRKVTEIEIEIIENLYKIEMNTRHLESLNKNYSTLSSFQNFVNQTYSMFPEFSDIVKFRPEEQLIVQPLFKKEVIALMSFTLGLSLGIFLIFMKLFLAEYTTTRKL